MTLLPVVPGDRYLACSDGLTGELTDDRIAGLVGADESPEAVAARLTMEAGGVGARDNVTVTLIQVATDPEGESTPR